MKKPRNERTGPQIARIAAKVLAMSHKEFWAWLAKIPATRFERDIRSMAASCLTQTKDKIAADRYKAAADHSAQRLDNANAAIREHSDLCDSLFVDVEHLKARLHINDTKTLSANLLRAISERRYTFGLGVRLTPAFMNMLRALAKPNRKATAPKANAARRHPRLPPLKRKAKPKKRRP